jgi:hypothetical protein
VSSWLAAQSRLARRELVAVAIGAAVLAGLALDWALSGISLAWALAGTAPASTAAAGNAAALPAAAWAASGTGLAVAGLIILLAAANGFSKAYSP